MASEATRKERYDMYLASPEWKERRKRAIDRAEHRCQVCNSKNHLDAHHRTYARFEHENPGDLTVLCRSCHKLFHGKSKLATNSSDAKVHAKANPTHVKQAEAVKKKRRRQKRAARRYAERPSATSRRAELAASVLREQREAEAA